jgi:hypothetical protein
LDKKAHRLRRLGTSARPSGTEFRRLGTKIRRLGIIDIHNPLLSKIFLLETESKSSKSS